MRLYDECSPRRSCLAPVSTACEISTGLSRSTSCTLIGARSDPLPDVDGEPDVARLQWTQPPEHDPGPHLGHGAQGPPEGRPDDVRDRDALDRLSARTRSM